MRETDIEDYISDFKITKKIKNAPFNYSEFSTQLNFKLCFI